MIDKEKQQLLMKSALCQLLAFEFEIFLISVVCQSAVQETWSSRVKNGFCEL